MTPKLPAFISPVSGQGAGGREGALAANVDFGINSFGEVAALNYQRPAAKLCLAKIVMNIYSLIA